MTTDDQYVPSEDDVRIAYVDEWVAQSDFLTRHQEREAERAGEAAWDRFLARVRRDAARDAEARIKAVQHLIDQADEMGEWAITCTRLQWAIDGSAPQPGA